MGIMDRLESRATSGTLGPPRDPVVAAWFGGMASSATGLSITPDIAMRSTVVYRCVSLLAQTYASLPLHVFLELDNGGKNIDKAHPRYRLLHDQPNRYQTSFEWREMMAGHFALRNRAYSEIIPTGGNAVDQLIPLHPDRVRPFRAPDGRLAFNYSPVSGPSRVILQSEMHYLHGMVMDSDGVTPLSPVAANREAIGLALAAEEHTARLFGNGTRLGGVLKFPAGKTLKDDPARKNLLDSWRKAQSGLKNVGKTAILEDGLEWQELGMTAMDAQLAELRGLQIAELCRIWGIPPHLAGDLLRCMPADTLVYSKAGPKRIADVKPGDEVWCPSPQGVKLSRVLNNWYNGVRDILSIRTTNRTVRCTANHRLLVRRAHERPLNPGEIGGRNVGGEKKRVFWRDEYVQAGELKAGDTLVTLDRLPEDGITVAPSGRNLTVGFMEFSGLLVSDGNITYENGKPRGAQIARGDKANYMYPYRQTMRTEFVRYPASGRGAVALAMEPVTVRESQRQTVFSSVVVGQELFDLGFHGTAYTKRVPGWVFETSEELRLAFLRGFLDGDGTVDRKGRITFYSANQALLDDIRHLCIGAGIPVTNTRSDVNGPKAFGNGTRMHRFTCSDPGANRRIGSHDKRYQVRFAAGQPFCRKDRAYPRFGGKDATANGLALSRIQSIERQPAEPVFDIEVEGEHCFFADGVGSHNSTNNNIEHQGIEFVTHTIRPGAVRWEQAMLRDLFAGDGVRTHCAEFNLEGLMRGDSAARSAYYSSGLQNAYLNPNQVRLLENMNPSDDPEMDKFHIQSNMALIDKLADMVLGKTQKQKDSVEA